MGYTGRLEGKLALVTGSGTGLGREIALEFAREGADVVVHCSKSKHGAYNAADEIQGMGRRATVFEANFMEVDACRALVDKAIDFLGGLDILVNNAGITLAGNFLEAIPEEFDLLYNVNIRAQFFCAQRAIQHMLGHDRKGVIINMTSCHAFAGIPGHSIYAGTKGAIRSWTRELAVELAPLGIRVNAIAPGWIAVESHFKQIKNLDLEAAGKLIPYRRTGTPLDVAKACVFLASDDSDYLIGHVMNLDGGVTAKMALPLEELDLEFGDVTVD